MGKIIVEHNPSAERITELGATNWDIWDKEISEFPYFYDEQEICYFLEGDVTVTPKDGAPVSFGKGDIVTFPIGMSCTWKIHQPVRKHYRFGL